MERVTNKFNQVFEWVDQSAAMASDIFLDYDALMRQNGLTIVMLQNQFRANVDRKDLLLEQ